VPYADAPRLFAKAAALPGIEASGIHMHIGSQITDLGPFRNAFTLMRELVSVLRAAGHRIQHLDLGGGLGVPYHSGNDIPPSPQAYAEVVRETLGDLGLKIVLEPGRVIVANAGVLVSRVIYAKRGRDKTFTVVDAAMNDLIRPTLYEAEHEIWPVREAAGREAPVLQDVVGPVCETGDYLALNRKLPPFAAGELIAFMVAGVMAATRPTTRACSARGAGDVMRGPSFAPPHLRRPHRTRPHAGVAELGREAAVSSRRLSPGSIKAPAPVDSWIPDKHRIHTVTPPAPARASSWRCRCRTCGPGSRPGCGACRSR
jgi:hypothetical protein